MHGRRPFGENRKCQFSEAYTDAIVTEKLYTSKEFVVMESSSVEFHQYLYINAIQKLVFFLPHVHIIGTHHCNNSRQEAFKCRSDFQDVLFRHYYSERVVSRFAY